MAQHRDTGIQRIKLSNGNWADVRTRLTVGDVRHQQTEAHSRGFMNDALDGLSLLPRLITKWSYGDGVTEELIDALDAQDAMAILAVVNAQAAPNPSSLSSDGTDEGESPTLVSLPGEWLIANICEAFGCTPDVAEQQDYDLCTSIIAMRNFAKMWDMEEDDPKALPADGRRFLIELERMADGSPE